jgi:hypothetical protein
MRRHVETHNFSVKAAFERYLGTIDAISDRDGASHGLTVVWMSTPTLAIQWIRKTEG